MTDTTTLSGVRSAHRGPLADLLALAEQGLNVYRRRDALRELTTGLAEGDVPPPDVEARLAALRAGETDPDVLDRSREAEIEAARTRLGLPPRQKPQDEYDERHHRLRHTGTLKRHVPRSLPPHGLDLHYNFDRQADLIGEGAFARVYVAAERGTDRFVAVKLLKDEALHNTAIMPVLEERFRREAWALEHVEDCGVSGVVRLVEIGDEGGHPYLVTTFHEGGTLGLFLCADEYQGGIPLPAALRWGIDLFESIAALHEAGIVHRDIKPANLLMENDPDPFVLATLDTHPGRVVELPRLVLADAGAVLMIGEERLHQHGRAPRTVLYAPLEALPDPSLAPEEDLNILPEIGPHTDVYSAASVLLEMLVGTAELQRMRSILDGSYAPTEADLDRIGFFVEMAPMFAACFDPYSARRESDARKVARTLSELLEHLQGVAP